MEDNSGDESREPEKIKRVKISVSLYPDQIAALRNYAGPNRWSVSTAVVEVVQAWMEGREPR